MYDLSILIPARNEIFLRKTVENILENMRGNTEILIGLDGEWAEPRIPTNDHVSILKFPNSIGQRAITNKLASISEAKYVMKVDAHCAFDEGFDIIMMEDMQDGWTLTPKMYNLHGFDWVCSNGHRRYQGKSGVCEECGEPTERDIVWMPRRWNGTKGSPETTAMLFDNTLRFGYWSGYKKKQGDGDIVETMSLLGACWMATREKYWELQLCDEKHGSWGQQGTEVACKTWLSGGKLMVTKRTWFAHMFRTQGGDFGFPYPNPGITKARRFSRDLWLNNKWDKAVHKLDWLIAKFAPVPGWDISKGILYYTDNQLDPKIMSVCQKQLRKCAGANQLVSVSLEPIDLGENIHLPLERGYLTMFKQILAGLEALESDIVYFCEHDILYHPSHFDFIPPKDYKCFYNTNVWKVRYSDGHAMRTAKCQQTSGLVGYRELLLEHYRKRVELVEQNGYSRSMGFEPGTHNRAARVDDLNSESYESKFPNLDIRHEQNLTPSRWSPEQFRNKRYTKGWQEADELPGWGVTKGRFEELLCDLD